MILRLLLALAAALAVTACAKPVEPATPALWEVTGPDGQHAYLFGTIHALPPQVAWQSPRIEAALAASDRLVLEIRQLKDRDAMQAIFARLARTPGQPPLSARVSPRYRPALARLLDRAGLADGQFADIETWAAALTLAQAARGADSGQGVDRVLMGMAGNKPVEELEGTAAQLGLFDTLPESKQRDLLDSVIAEAGQAAAEESLVEGYWRRGDMEALARETHRGMLADKELRDILLVRRNAAWAERVAAMMRAGQRPFVAAGAAHMAGPEGLPALLAGRGYTVRRVQ